MFNDKYGLTEAVLSGRKTMTRRVCKLSNGAGLHSYMLDKENRTVEILTDRQLIDIKPAYWIGEEVAVAQSGYDILQEIKRDYGELSNKAEIFKKAHMKEAFWYNKMFVSAYLCPHRIQIINIKVEQLQAISDEECLREGVIPFDAPRVEFANLIDKISGKGTWERNPYVFVYSFKLIK